MPTAVDQDHVGLVCSGQSATFLSNLNVRCIELLEVWLRIEVQVFVFDAIALKHLFDVLDIRWRGFEVV